MNLFDLIGTDLNAIIDNDGKEITYRRSSVNIELTIKVLPFATNVNDVANAEGYVAYVWIREKDLDILTTPEYGDEIIFERSDTDEFYEVWKVREAEPIFPGSGLWKCFISRNVKPVFKK